MQEDTIKLLQTISDIIIASIPIVAGVWYTAKKLWKNKVKELSDADRDRAMEELKGFDRILTMRTLDQIKEICNLYRDKSNADLISFTQVENGTVATTKLQNLYLSCVAESDRYSNIPPVIGKIQRMPLSIAISYCNYVQFEENPIFIKRDCNDIGHGLTEESANQIYPPECKSWIVLRIIDNSIGAATGAITFKYSSIINDEMAQKESALVKECAAAIEGLLILHHSEYKKKKKSLKLS